MGETTRRVTGPIRYAASKWKDTITVTLSSITIVTILATGMWSAADSYVATQNELNEAIAATERKAADALTALSISIDQKQSKALSDLMRAIENQNTMLRANMADQKEELKILRERTWELLQNQRRGR